MNYYNYFTEIEEHFQRKRGAQVWLSPVDWALIASWQAAGIPLSAVLAGVDAAFEKFASGRRPDTARRRSLLYCAAAVREAAEAAQQAAVGGHGDAAAASRESDGFTHVRVTAHLESALTALGAAPAQPPAEIAERLMRLRDGLRDERAPAAWQEIDRVLSVLDDKVLAWLQQATPVDAMVALRTELENELAPYRRRLRAEQLTMIERQFLQRRLLERVRLPRLSLFFMA